MRIQQPASPLANLTETQDLYLTAALYGIIFLFGVYLACAPFYGDAELEARRRAVDARGIHDEEARAVAEEETMNGFVGFLLACIGAFIAMWALVNGGDLFW